jgi:16S rRNA (uracil1498-N3)-methyltransferase
VDSGSMMKEGRRAGRPRRMTGAAVPRYDFNAPRLFVEAELEPDAQVALTHEQANYLLNVLRLRAGDQILAFNGRDGEWRSTLDIASRKSIFIRPQERTRAQARAADLHYLFAPLKQARQDYMVQKAVEMGASRLRPVMTRRTQAIRVNLARMRANAIEAAEQCGILTIPQIDPEMKLDALASGWPSDRLLIFCDEDAEVLDPLASLRAAAASSSLAVLIGPEGGFDPSEREMLRRMPGVVILSLGPRILRADTAAVAALALVQAALGDWL